MSLVATILLGVGILLVYSAVKNKNPAQVVKDALRQGKATSAPLGIPLPKISLPLGGLQVSDPLLAGGKWTRPVSGGKITARFGDRGTRWSGGIHTGLDFAVPDGTPVFAVGNGTINLAGPTPAYGYRIVERVAGGDVLYYAHLSQI